MFSPALSDISVGELFAQASGSPGRGPFFGDASSPQADAEKLTTISEGQDEDKLSQSIGSAGAPSLSPAAVAAQARRVSLAASSASFRPPR